MNVINYICLGCEENCKMDSPRSITGCVYEDGDFPRDADIWVPDYTPKCIIAEKRKSIESKKK